MTVQKMSDGSYRVKQRDDAPTKKDLNKYKQLLKAEEKLWIAQPKTLSKQQGGNLEALSAYNKAKSDWVKNMRPLLKEQKSLEKKYSMTEGQFTRMASKYTGA